MQVCPHPNCGYRAEFISKVHCRLNHNMEREEMFKKYGQPRIKNPFNKLDDEFDKVTKLREMESLRRA